jgi:hypothetical protein
MSLEEFVSPQKNASYQKINILEQLPEIERDPQFFPDEAMKATPGFYEFEHKKNISRFMMEKAKFTEDQIGKYFKVVDFLQEKYTQNGKLLTRKKEKNILTENLEPTINHCLKVSDRLIQFILVGECTLKRSDIYEKTKKWVDISSVRPNLFAGSIAALLHDVIEDKLSTWEEVEELLKNTVGLLPENQKRVLTIVNFLTRREAEPFEEFMKRSEEKVSFFKRNDGELEDEYLKRISPRAGFLPREKDESIDEYLIRIQGKIDFFTRSGDEDVFHYMERVQSKIELFSQRDEESTEDYKNRNKIKLEFLKRKWREFPEGYLKRIEKSGFFPRMEGEGEDDYLKRIEAKLDFLIPLEEESSFQYVQRIGAKMDFVTRREEEAIYEYMERIENARTKKDIAARLAQITKICDIEVNGESEHSTKQVEKYEEEYIHYLFDRFRWINDLFPKWMDKKILDNNPYLKAVVRTVKRLILKEISLYFKDIRRG